MTPQEKEEKKENAAAPELELEWLDDFAADEPEAPKKVPEEKPGESKKAPEKPEEKPEEKSGTPKKPEEPAKNPETPKEKPAKSGEIRHTAQQRHRAEEKREKPSGSALLMILCAVVAIGSAVMVIRAVYYYQNARSTYADARNEHVTNIPGKDETLPAAPIEADPVVAPPKESGDVRPEGATLEIDFDALKEINPEVVAWLHVPALDLSYPVMQGEDNEFYLTHTLEKEYNPLGSIFMECTNLPDFSHGNTLLYGHNTTDGSMFGRLREFGADPALRENDPYFYVYQADGSIGRYRIYSYYSVYKDSDSFAWFTDAESYDYYVNLTKNLSIDQIDADFSQRNNLVTLSTCFGASGTPYRFLVHGVRE